ncbi:FAD-dependent oxidoreductase [Dactylosporangium matsuzakiense]|uniref:CoA-disulfide reductase n=1 Tax=Dactylosporangium matsuzakiense TaxID=53360 RepID=A0A9W6KV81_9ACTN|nr:FAD-dependent oxidoreductase [Dactylosporangium matsuzakiense]UWZ42267.1 FAD-dependent oxidoreductase [Dactylosporangium matsuzakiense]GLL07309.1 CoA-disulfide reductase [Dactylosporangium matsuzakiense]
MKTVIVGAVAGGMSAATRLRRLDPTAQIVVFERGEHVSYANCGLPYHVGGVIADRGSLLLHTPDSLRARFDLDVRVRAEVVAVDRARQVVLVREVAGGAEYEERYDRLVLSPGAAPFVPDLPGIERAMTLRSVTDADRFTALLAERQPRTAVVVGGGFIGLETAENLHLRGLAVSLVELDRQVLAPLDPEMVAAVHTELRRHGVALHLGTALTKVLPDAVELADGRLLAADLVVLAIGVRPEVGLARAAGLTIGPRGGIAVDDTMRTSDRHIYAVGDAVEKTDRLSGETALIPLANTANRQGRLVADAIAGRPVHLDGRLGTAIVQIFDLTVAVTGWNEKRLRAAGRTYQAIHTHPASHAGYYPGAEPMSLKLLFDPGNGRILGAQAVGGAGVDKRIDVLATAMRAGLTADELADLELAYAPAFSSAKDPVNMLGYIVDNLLTDAQRTVQWHELDAAVTAGATLIDVRTAAEHAAGHIPGSLNLPLDELRARMDELPAGDLIVYCQVGQRGHTATALLNGLNRRAANLDGGYRTWHAATTDG